MRNKLRLLSLREDIGIQIGDKAFPYPTNDSSFIGWLCETKFVALRWKKFSEGTFSFYDTKTLASIRAVYAGVFDVFSFIQASRSGLADLTRSSSWAGYNEVDIGDCGGAGFAANDLAIYDWRRFCG